MNDETPLDDPFVGAVGRAGAVHGGGNAAWQPGVHDAGAGAACAGSCGGGAHGLVCVGVWAEPPLPLPPEQLLEPPRTLDPATLLDLPEPVA